MKNRLALATLLLLAPAGVFAQTAPSTAIPADKTQTSSRLNPVQVRANRLSDQMVRELRLNGYQAARLRAINADKVAKMDAIERRNAGNPKLVENQCLGVCKERDQELQGVLSSSQYSAYYDSRSDFYKYDKDYAATASNASLVRSIQNPSPSSRGATIAPARSTTQAAND